jgi:hypothetical protein
MGGGQVVRVLEGEFGSVRGAAVQTGERRRGGKRSAFEKVAPGGNAHRLSPEFYVCRFEGRRPAKSKLDAIWREPRGYWR